ncbi:hypothetical protein Vretifemale_17831, partial [Volvox reticuliferus]
VLCNGEPCARGPAAAVTSKYDKGNSRPREVLSSQIGTASPAHATVAGLSTGVMPYIYDWPSDGTGGTTSRLEFLMDVNSGAVGTAYDILTGSNSSMNSLLRVGSGGGVGAGAGCWEGQEGEGQEGVEPPAQRDSTRGMADTADGGEARVFPPLDPSRLLRLGLDLDGNPLWVWREVRGKRNP